MFEKIKEFVEVCKAYNLTKDKGTFQLFQCFLDTFLYVHLDRFEKVETNRLELAKAIQVFNSDKDIVISGTGAGKVKITDEATRTTLLLYMHTLLQIESMGLYQVLGIASEKKKVGDDFHFKKHLYFSGWDFYEPFTDEEITKIIEFESFEEGKNKVMQGKAQGGIPKLGFFVEKFIVSAPSLFGDIICSNESPKMNETNMYNLIGEMLVLADVVQLFYHQSWLNEWNNELSRSEKRKIVKDWLASYQNACKKHIEKTGMVSGSTPEGFLRKIASPDNVVFKKDQGEGLNNYLALSKLRHSSQEKELFEKLNW